MSFAWAASSKAEDPSLGLIFLLETRDQPQPGSPLSRFLGREEERPWERGCILKLKSNDLS